MDPAPAAKPSVGKYWALWKQVEKRRPGLNRFALTSRVIGRVPKPQNMTPADLGKMIDVFTAILRDAGPSAKAPPTADKPSPAEMSQSEISDLLS